jgi:hypothetical protein
MGLQIITTEAGEELVVLPRRQYDALLAQLGDEEAEDRMTLLLAQEASAEEALPAAISAAIVNGQSRLHAICAWRGIAIDELAARAGVEPSIAAMAKEGTAVLSDAQLASLSVQLNVPISWLS